jgi:hypothetical protein
VLFSGCVGAASYSTIREEFEIAASKPSDSFIPDLPIDCSEARGKAEADYRVSEGLCWYPEPTFRVLFPEYKDLDENSLSTRLYARAGRPLKPIRPWRTVLEKAGIAFGVPLAVLALGWSLIWAFSGFRGSAGRP